MSKRLMSLIFGLVAGAGGVMAGRLIRQRLVGYGLSESSANAAMERARQATYRMSNRRFRLVSKGDDMAYMLLTNTVHMEDQVVRPGDEIITQDGLEGIVVAPEGRYVKIASDGKLSHRHSREIMRKADLILHKGHGLTTWDRMPVKYKADIAKDARLPDSIIHTRWDNMSKSVKEYIAYAAKGIKPCDKVYSAPTRQPSQTTYPMQHNRHAMERIVKDEVICDNCHSEYSHAIAKCHTCGKALSETRMDSDHIAEEANDLIKLNPESVNPSKVKGYTYALKAAVSRAERNAGIR